MIEKIIHSYINKLTKEDIKSFAEQNQVSLTEEEVNIIYEVIKNHWRELLYNPQPIFDKLKNQVSSNTYQKIIYFYDLYSKKLPLLSNFH